MKLSSSKFEKPTDERGFFEKESSKLLRNFKNLHSDLVLEMLFQRSLKTA